MDPAPVRGSPKVVMVQWAWRAARLEQKCCGWEAPGRGDSIEETVWLKIWGNYKGKESPENNKRKFMAHM